MKPSLGTLLLYCLCPFLVASSLNAEEKKLAVFVIGTHHYNPAATLPGIARQLESLGFRTAIVAGENPEKNGKGLTGLEILKQADVAIFCVRFLTLPDYQLKIVDDYVKSGKPVVGIRTSTHAFAYPASDSRANWNDGFGRDALGARYLTHLEGGAQIEIAPEAKTDPVLTGIDTTAWTDPGTLYILEPAATAKTLLIGTAKSKRIGTITNAAGSFKLEKTMRQGVAWTWTNAFGGRAFTTTLGHPEGYANSNTVRLLINGIHWAAGRPVPPASVNIAAIHAGMEEVPKTPTQEPRGAAPIETKEDDADTLKELEKFGIFGKSEPLPKQAAPVVTKLPLELQKGDRIALIGNTLFEREQDFGYIEALIQKRFPQHQLVFRNLSWSADTIDLQPRPANFASTAQHLTRERIDVIFAAFGFNESFAGEAGLPAFRTALTKYLAELKSKAFNGRSAARIVIVSPIANENTPYVAAGDLNNARVAAYAGVMRAVANEQHVGFADVFTPLRQAMTQAATPLTYNGIHLEDAGYALFSTVLFRELFGETAPQADIALRDAVREKNRQYFRRFRPLNTFYYTGERTTAFGYLDFLPAMRSFDIMVTNRDQRVWAIAQGQHVPDKLDDSNVPEMPKPLMNRSVNPWKSAADEQKCFKVDPRFVVNLFASEEQFPEIANPIQMRWDSRGRLWVSCSTTYPHVYPGREPRDRLVILEDTDHDGKADKLTVFAENLHIPLSFEFGGGGVYVSEMPHLVFLKDTNGDDKADLRQVVLSGFGTEDSHHSLHDFAWSPDGDLIFRESIFHHSQVETPYGPVRMQNSGWFRFDPRSQRLISFGSYPSTNPWGVTFDAWGQHLASHPVYAEAFHALNPPYPMQHPAPTGLRAYSGTSGQTFVDVSTFPKELQGCFIKNRYKPTNRVEIHKWIEQEFGYDEEYVSDLLFSTDLCFIPVDIKFGPRGDLYICDWYNPIKGHAQYALRDERRDHSSGRIWRITAKNTTLFEAPNIHGACTPDLIDTLKRPESFVREWARRELRERDAATVGPALNKWVASLDRNDRQLRHHQMEAIWVYRGIGMANTALLGELLTCNDAHARAAATQQLRYWYTRMPDAIDRLRTAANDSNGIVRMQAALAASYIGSKEALDAMLDIAKQPRDKHLAYAFVCALGSESLRRIWENNPAYADVPKLLKLNKAADEFTEKQLSPANEAFDKQADVAPVRIECVPEQMRYSQTRFVVKAGQPVKLVFANADGNDHNLVIVKPDALDEVGLAANEMAKDPKNANSDFIPQDKKSLIVQYSPMIGPGRKSKMQVLRFKAPQEPGIYPYVCTFPGHWVAMTGEMLVVKELKDVDALLATRKEPQFVKEWAAADFTNDLANLENRDLMRGMKVFAAAKCMVCHTVDSHGGKIGPDLTKISEKYKGEKLLLQILEPSAEIDEKYRMVQIRKTDGQTFVGTFVKEDDTQIQLRTNPLQPDDITTLSKNDIARRTVTKLSAMPTGLLNTLKKEEILDLLRFLEAGGYPLPNGLKHHH